MDRQAWKEHQKEQKRREEFSKKLKMLEEQRRSGQLGNQQKEWQKEQDKLLM